ncbi:MAG: hypothetical protein F2650_07015 [Actinobacteria bacterium]|uniref:Unannotated protein n=1 Tax=freshwater metagenome TaxID=449393 RepID=A0A6J6NFY2_9ZZZZ|nr:hypothetical protein [Actinomycetota bacterium]
MTRVGPGTFELGATALSRYQKVCLATASVMMAIWFIALGIPTSMTSVAHAAQVNSYSTFGTVSYDAGSCGVDSTAGVVSSPGVKKILKVSNTEIYVVGCFTNFAGVAEADYVAKWNGTSWTALGVSGDINAIVHDVVVYKGDIHIAGEFTNAGGDVAADMVAKWNGSAWVGLPVTGGINANNGLGSPQDLSSDFAAALKVQENSVGTSDDILLVAGKFYFGINDGRSGYQIPYTSNIATWNGSTWGSVDVDSQSFSSTVSDYVVHDIEIVGSSIYASGYRNAGYGSNKAFAFHKFDGTTWTKPISVVSASFFGTGFGIYTMETVGTNIYVGGNFTGLSSVASHVAVYNTTSGTFSAFNGFSAQFGTGAVVRTISMAGSQLFVGGSFPGVTGTSGGVARWDGSAWQGIGRTGPAIVNALLSDMSYDGSNSRMFIGSSNINIGDVAAADGFAALAISSVSTMDSMSVDVGTLTPSFDPSVTSYSLTIPNSSASVTFTAIASASGSEIKRTNSFGTLAMSSDTETLSVAEGATANISFAVSAISGASSTSYAVAVARSSATTTSAPTTVAPTTVAPTTIAPTPPAAQQENTTTTIAAAAVVTLQTPSAPVIQTPSNLLKKGTTASKSRLLSLANLIVPSAGKYALRVTTSSVCKVSGTGVKALKAGTCKAVVTVTPKGKKATSKTISLKIS